MTEIVKKEWAELSSIWNELIDRNPLATSFQSYEFLTFTGKGKTSHKEFFRLFGLRELNVVLYKNHIPIAIAPLLYKTSKGKSAVYFRGHFTAASQLDFIYSDLSYDDFQVLMDGIKSLLGSVTFCLNKVYYASPTYEYLKTYLPSARISAIECYAIPLPKHYDEWYENLHKSRHRTYKLSRNRMAKDHVQYSVSFSVGKAIDSATYKEMMQIYADRFLTKNNFHFGPLQSIAKKVVMPIIMRDKMTRWINRDPNSFHAILYMNNEVAAFANGQILKDKRMHGSRLAINMKYRKYSPGGLIVSAMVRYLIEQTEAGNIDVDTLDMGQGGSGGDAYKISYGAQLYPYYYFECDCA